MKDNINKAIKEDYKNNPIILDSESNYSTIFSEGKIEQISDHLKGKFLNKAIVSYKVKCK